ncbi:MAG: VWA domain-containing protein [Cyanobacteria bacterium REEB67]|nr:VWA domain-containing protein [Cyanobacteria bacterium REEB67]
MPTALAADSSSSSSSSSPTAATAQPEIYSPVPMAVPSLNSNHTQSNGSDSSSTSMPAPVPVQVAPTANQGEPPIAPQARSKRIFPSAASSSSSSSSGSGLSAPLRSGTDATTMQIGTQNTTLQVGTQNTTLQAGTGSSLLRTGVERQAEQVNILFIVDGSRSMLDDLEHGVQKIDAAKQVLQNALSNIPPDVNLGLRVFGQGYSGAQGGTGMFGGGFGSMASECRNTALWVPIGKNNRVSIITKVRGLKPYGMTPLAYSIAQAAFSDFRGLQGSKVIILITDGADTCMGDPCKVIRELLPRYGIKIKVDVVGLSLHREPQARNQLNCISENSGGKYYDAKTAADLIDSVSASVSKAIEGRVIIRPSQPVNPLNGQTPQPDDVPVESVPLQNLPR